jgi:hypothetical protein
VSDNWDDWFKYSTLFHLSVADASGVTHNIGSVKIGQFGMAEEQRSPNLPGQFDRLDTGFFSLGQDDEYYAALNALGDDLRDQVLAALRDVAAHPALFERALQEDVTANSLLRSVTPSTVRGQFRRMAGGGTRLSRYSFAYEAPKPKSVDVEPVAMDFEVEPDSFPPTNIHVLIGRNGVGKTYLLSKMTGSLLGLGGLPVCGAFSFGSGNEADRPTRASNSRGSEAPFANLVSVSFSAFDEFELIADRKPLDDGVGYAYIGLKRTSNRGAERGAPKSPDMLKREFVDSFRECLVGSRKSRWQRAISALQTDPVFRDSDVASLISADASELSKRAASVFGRLSSGHKIILLTTTRLVELVEERTLVMLDEPEAHLHPPLLAAFIRALSDLLINRNGVALVATHSPVVLQEVPRACAWVLRRSGHCTTAERPAVETFGENVGVLTREVFGLELTHSGYHGLLEASVARHGSYESVLAEYGGSWEPKRRRLSGHWCRIHRRIGRVRSLPMPSDDPAEVFELCISRVRDENLKSRLQSVTQHVANVSSNYLEAATAGALFEVSPEAGAAGVVAADEMEYVYTGRMAARRSPGRSVYDRLLSAPPHGICPFCGQRTVTTLDHYLPKARFSPLVVAPMNLVPSCSECNKAKSEFSPTRAGDQHPHPYFDEFDDGRWLAAKLREDSPPALLFRCQAPSDWSETKASRIERHFDALNLGALYSSHAAQELVNLRGSLRRIFPQLGRSGVREHLWVVAEGCRDAQLNSWQTAMYAALHDSDWFCDGGFDF